MCTCSAMQYNINSNNIIWVDEPAVVVVVVGERLLFDNLFFLSFFFIYLFFSISSSPSSFKNRLSRASLKPVLLLLLL